VGGGTGGHRHRHHVGGEERRAVQPVADRAQGAAGAHPGRLHLGAGSHRGRAHRGHGRKARRGVLGPAGGRGHRELVRLHAGARLPRLPAPGPVRRANNRARVIYREAGQFKSSYASDQAIFPIVQDRWVALALLAAAVVVPAALGSDYWLQAILIPFLIYALAALGLNILLVFVLSGLAAAVVGLIFGIPSLRIKGFYLAVATLASQFFLIWLFNKVAWFTNYASSGTITAPDRALFGVLVTGPNASPEARYVVAIGVALVFALLAKNLVRGRV